MAGRWSSVAYLLAAAAVLAGLGGCAPLAQLPDFAKLPERVLSRDEQQGKVNQMIEKGQTHQAEAAKQIEQGK
jgi:hypothetical protein